MEQQSSSCVKDVSNSILPASFSLHSVDLLPVVTDEKNSEPTFCCLTLRNTSNGHLYDAEFQSKSEIRILHASREAHRCVNEVLTGGGGSDKADDQNGTTVNQHPEGLWTMPFRIPISETKTTIQVCK